MPLAVALVLVAIDAILIVHVVKTGQLRLWAYLILAVPGLGALAYVAVQLLPAWADGLECWAMRRRIRRALAPERRYRALVDQLAIADTTTTRAALAEQCRRLGLFAEARIHYDNVLARAGGSAPIVMLGKAHAEFGLGRFAETVETLDALKARWPGYDSRNGRLLHVCALEEGSRIDEASEWLAAAEAARHG